MSKKMSVVVWNDAHATLDQLTFDEIKAKSKPHVIHTYGYIVISDESMVAVAGEWLPPDFGDEDSYRSLTFIPRGMVVSETGLTAKRVRKPKEVTPSTS